MLVSIKDQCFFKVLLSEELWIPPMFSRTFIGEEDWEEVKLTSSMGKTWGVKIHKDVNGFHHFGKGWGDFARAHDLRFGYFLVFHYKGSLVFDVTIFDLSECNKWYLPAVGKENRVDDKAIDVEDYNISKKIKEEEEEIMTHPQRTLVSAEKQNLREKKKHHLTLSKKQQQDLSSECKQNNSKMVGDNWMDNAFDIKNYESSKDVGSRQKVEEANCKVQMASEAKEDCFIRKKGIELLKKPQFIVTLKDSNFRRPSLAIPAKFEGSKFLLGKRHVILRDEKGKTWHVNLYHNHKNKNALLFQIGTGWQYFAHDNRLKVGDVCRFKLVSTREDVVMLFEVLGKRQID